MKTAVSIPDELFEEAERLASELGLSRSRLYQFALTEYLARHDADRITEGVNAVCDEIDTGAEPWLVEAGRRVLERAEW